jgi:hypothetical protein
VRSRPRNVTIITYAPWTPNTPWVLDRSYAGCGLPRMRLLETVWRIAEGVLDRVCSVAQDGEMGLLHPLCPLAEPPTGAFPIFQTVSLGNQVNKYKRMLAYVPKCTMPSLREFPREKQRRTASCPTPPTRSSPPKKFFPKPKLLQRLGS